MVLISRLFRIAVNMPVKNADGTFKSAPPLFNQFFVIHEKLNDGSIFPLIYSVMTHKTEQAYDILLNFLADELGEFEPESIMIDFEMASRKSYSVFQLLNNGVRYFASLAFIPPSDVFDAYEKILKLDFFVKNNQIIFPFLTYFEETLIGTKKRGRRYPPLFPIPLWNVYKAIKSDWDKTNICEGFNNGFAHLLSAQHPSIYKFINGLRRQQNLTEIKISQSIVGNPNTPNKKNKTVSWAERVKKIVADYHNREFEDYLQGSFSSCDSIGDMDEYLGGDKDEMSFTSDSVNNYKIIKYIKYFYK
ncbi:hypothetical protein QTP88_004642 [Uroleucon formosanum]